MVIRKYRLQGLDCADCAAKMERRIGELKGVESVNISFLMGKMTIEYNTEDIDSVLKEAIAIIHDLEPQVKVG